MTKVCNVSLKDCDPTCLSVKRKWWYYVATSSALWLSGILIIVTVRIVTKLCRSRKVKGKPNAPEKRKGGEEASTQTQWILSLREGAANLLTAQTFKGRCLVVISFILSVCYIVLYVIESSYPIEHCLDITGQQLWMFEIGFNLFFIIHFLLRFLAANDKLWFWCDPLSLVDFFTIPQVFISLVIKQNWLGLRFLRAMQFIRLADILQFMGILKSSGAIIFVVMIGNLCALWFTFGGLIHLTENSGDPWNFYSEHTDLNYFNCLYFLVVTMSTVGFGDIYPVTYLGKVLMVIFISIGLGMFATYIPAILEYLGSHTPYHGSFKTQEGRKHIVLCGHITRDSVENFLRDFLHKDRENIAVNVVIMANFIPSPGLQAVVKQHFVNVTFFKGSVLNGEDCDRVKMKRADACIILCDKECPDPDAEDEENIMRVVAVKDHSPGIRIIIQLMQYNNKSYLLNIPSWNSKTGDDVVCVSELKLGFLAQSCLSPGFSTLLANIFSMRSNELGNTADEHDWKTSYIRGVSNEMYTEYLSKSFKGLTFQQAAEICFEKLDLLMVAMEITKPDGEGVFAINPQHNMKVGHLTRGYFITGSSSQVKRVLYYCSNCHRDETDLELIKECNCEKGMSFVSRITKASLPTSEVVALPTKRVGSYKVLNRLKSLKVQNSPVHGRPNESDRPKFDLTCTFYWCPPRSFQDAEMTREDAKNKTFSRHILVCIFDPKDAPLHGLRTLVMPLRASNLARSELKTIVFLGNRHFLEREWAELSNFDDVFFLPGSPFCRADLRAINANLADMVVFLSPKKGNRVEDPQLADKESILASLNLKAMSFDDSIGLLKQSSRDAFMPLEFAGVSPKIERRGSAFGSNIPMITELMYDQNVKYLDPDDVEEEDMDLYKTQQFACGSAFTVSMLDSLISATYFSKDVLTLVRTLVTGGINPILEEHIAEGEEIKGTYETEENAESRSRCKITQISLYDGPLSQFGDQGLYGHMFLYALKKLSMICLAVYRFRDTKFVRGIPCAKRYVICAPPYKFQLQSTDLIFVLAHSDMTATQESSL